jgi:nucleotide-binding universal stress UspA family protein
MERVLIPVDGSESALRAVRHVIEYARRGAQPQVDVLNVQPPIYSANITRFLTREMIEEYYNSEGEAALGKARRLLDGAGLAYTALVRVGRIAETIADYAAEQACDRIVMGTRGMGALGQLVMGSVALKVLHLAQVPVTLVK